MFDVILAGVTPHQVGSASRLLESVQQLAKSLGIAVVGTVRFGVVGSSHGTAAFVGAADYALLIAVTFLAAAGPARHEVPPPHESTCYPCSSAAKSVE
jgi:hypothetical protein